MYKELLEEGVLDEVDAIRRAFEDANHGVWDVISDKLWETIDLATAPNLTAKQEGRLDFLRLDEQGQRPTIEHRLGTYGLVGTYRDVMAQIQDCQPSIFVDYL